MREQTSLGVGVKSRFHTAKLSLRFRPHAIFDLIEDVVVLYTRLIRRARYGTSWGRSEYRLTCILYEQRLKDRRGPRVCTY